MCIVVVVVLRLRLVNRPNLGLESPHVSAAPAG